MDIKFNTENSSGFWRGWNSYNDEHASSFRYLENFVQYMKLYSPYLIKDLSFLVLENGRTTGICFLPIEEINGIKSITLGGGFTVGPTSANLKTEKLIFQKIEEIAAQENIQMIKFYSEPLVDVQTDNYNKFRRYGYLDASSTDQILCLKPEVAQLWTNLRKSYKAMINSTLKNPDFQMVFIDQNNADYSVNENYRLTHIKAAGRETRPKSSFDAQFEMLKNGHGLIAGLKYKNRFIAFNYFLFHKKTAVYFSSADDPEYAEQKFAYNHVTLWSSFERLKSLGCDYLQMSPPASSHRVESFLDYSDSKQLDISFFKRGMGAEQKPFNRGIRYYNRDLFLKDLEQFKEKVLENHFGMDPKT